ncbi:MAG TPA: hypothetical protein VFG55_07230 [Rhodanobacteraceae bacterium]|nr:hypothetical protein [Rhodanobacteraceae bacterium]
MFGNRDIAFCSKLLPCVAFGFAAQAAQAVTYTVGGDVDCDYGTIQQSINELPTGGVHEIRIANSASYTAQAIAIAGRVLTLHGGYAHCADATPSGSTLLDGSGGGNDSVLTITGTGNDVILENLGLLRGDEVHDGYGGGIDFRGAGYLTLRNTAVTQNYAGYGGGISVTASGGAAEVRLEAGTYIALNTAQYSGGGIRAEGNTRVFMLGASSSIFLNEALGFDPVNSQPLYGYGGGIEVIGPARADLSAPITGNTARYGGGVAVVGADSSEDLDGLVRLFTTDPTSPVEVSGNRATQTGGGIWVKPDVGLDNESEARLCAYDFRIDENRAQQGSAIYADTDGDGLGSMTGGGVYLNTTGLFDDCGSEPPVALGAVACGAGVVCNTIDANVAEDANGQPTAGAAVLIQSGGDLDADRVAIRANQGAQALRGIGVSGLDIGSALINLHNCLFVDNVVSGQVVRTEESDIHLDLTGCTLANNTIGAAEVVSASDLFELRRSILWQPGKTSLMQSGGDRVVEYVVTSERGSLDGGSTPYVTERDPRFEDPAHGDYRPIAASPAVDAAPFYDEGGPNLDLDGRPRGIDIPIVANVFGDADIGAYERASTFSLVRNRGFGTDLRLWNEVTPGSATWQPDGASSAGAVYIHADPAVAGDLIGLSQCVRIPGPGVYALNGFGHSSGSVATRDYVRLHWKLRPSSPDETCDGAVAVEGDLNLPRGTAFAAPAAPALIDVPAEVWTSTTTVEITTIVHENGVTTLETTNGWFDDITFEPDFGDTIFEDGFDP